MRKHVITYSIEAILLGVGVVITALGIWAGVIWSRFGRNAEENVSKAAISLNGEVKSLERVNRNDVAIHRGKLPTAEGNIRALVKAVFNPTAASLAIDPLKLNVSGVELETEFPPTEVHKGQSWEGFFEIPQELEVTNAKATLVAYVGTEHFDSPEFPVPFERLKP
jgi:hypothetical protein